jgi:hypothetical protein
MSVMFRLFRSRHLSGTVILVGSAAMMACGLGACGGSVVEGPPQAPVANHGCIDDSAHCISQRQASLRALQADPSRSWVRQPASINSYATGVRLFAFKTEKNRLSCDDLGVGRREADSAPGMLRSPQAHGINPAIVSRGLMFATEVGRELTREQQRRCRV